MICCASIDQTYAASAYMYEFITSEGPFHWLRDTISAGMHIWDLGKLVHLDDDASAMSQNIHAYVDSVSTYLMINATSVLSCVRLTESESSIPESDSESFLNAEPMEAGNSGETSNLEDVQLIKVDIAVSMSSRFDYSAQKFTCICKLIRKND